MKNKIKILLIVLTISSFLFFVIYLVNSSLNKPFDIKEYNTRSNHILNLSNVEYANDIIYAGLDELDIDSVNVIVATFPDKLSNKLLQSADLHVDALITYDNGMYMIYIKNSSQSRLTKVLSHELIHLKQMRTGRLVNKKTHIEWEGKPYKNIPYEQREWEDEAFNGQYQLKQRIFNRLYK